MEVTVPSTLQVHPAAMLFPMMSDDELSQLADDIAANGLLEPVVLYHGQILDGRNRLKACELADVEPRFSEVDGDLPSATIYVLSKNLHRRQLTVSQRAAIAAEAVDLLQEEAKKRQGGKTKFGGSSQICDKPEASGRSSEIAAKEVGVGSRIVQHAVSVKREDPEAFEKIKRGELSVNAAAGVQERRRNSEDPSAPYEAKTDRQKKLAEGHKERMVKSLSLVTGVCSGLETADIRKIWAACEQEEIDTWIERAKELASQLRAFAARLQKGF